MSTTATAATPVFTVADAKAKCVKIRKHLEAFTGKEKHNPHIWIRDNLLKHEQNLDSSNTVEQAKAVAAIKDLPSEPTPSVKVEVGNHISKYNKEG